MIYEAINRPVLLHVPVNTRRLLDVGCGSGALDRQIKEKLDCHVVGITSSELEAELARKCVDEVLIRDLNGFDPSEAGKFDCIICSHVLEHLFDPEVLLKRLRKSLLPGGTLIVALPNVLYWRQRLEFFRGRFKYTDGGLMDRTHYRFFDWNTAQELLTRSGYTLIKAEACGGLPLSRFFSNLRGPIDRATLRRFPGLLGFQFVFVCEIDSTPNLEADRNGNDSQ